MSQTRQLAAIMFTDIVGYTTMMGKDSDKALELVRISEEIQKPLVEQYNSQWLKEMLMAFYMGDKDPGALTRSISYENEFGRIETTEIFKDKFRERILVYRFDSRYD